MKDERLKKIMADLGMPESRSLKGALEQVANEVAQEVHKTKCDGCVHNFERKPDKFDWVRPL